MVKQLVEECYGPLQRHPQRAIVHRLDTQGFHRHFAAVDGLGVLQGVQDEGVLGGILGVHGAAPGEHEVVGGDGLAVAPAGVFAQMENRFLGTDVPALGDAAHQPVLGVVAQQTFHDVAEHADAHLVGSLGAVELWRLFVEYQRDRAAGRVHRLAAATATAGEAGGPGQAYHQQRDAGHGGDAEQGELFARGAREVVLVSGDVAQTLLILLCRSSCRSRSPAFCVGAPSGREPRTANRIRARRALPRCYQPLAGLAYCTVRSRLPTIRSRCIRLLHSSA